MQLERMQKHKLPFKELQGLDQLEPKPKLNKTNVRVVICQREDPVFGERIGNFP